MAARKTTKAADLERVEGEVMGTEIVPAAPAEMEFRLINPTEDGFLREIKWNRAELEAAIKQKVAVYENVVYTDENIQQAKADRAELNKLTKAIEDRRKMVKNIIMEPYTTFEGEIKEVLELIKKPVGMIDTTIKEYENQQKEEKKQKIVEVYDEVIGDLKEVLPFEKVFDPRYLNATYALSKAQGEVREKVERVRRDLDTIDGLDSKYKLNAKDVYIKTMDLSQALAENKRLTELEEKLEAEKRRKAEEEAERKRLEEERRKAEEERKAEEAAKAVEEPKAETPAPETPAEQPEVQKSEDAVVDPFAQKAEAPKEEPKRYRTRFYALGTKDQLNGLIQYMKDNNIEYGRIEK